MDCWIHCNKCLAQGNPRLGALWFTSCGHIICSNCMKRGGISPGYKAPCLICQSVTSIMEINRSMKPELLALFRPPKDMLSEFTKRINAAINFQTGHRHALQKRLIEKNDKAMKYMKNAQSEIARKVEQEKALVAENQSLLSELNKSKEYAKRLEQLLAERDNEIQRLRKSPTQRQTPYNKKRIGFPSLNGNTPITSLSFLGCPTSTPNEQGMDMAFLDGAGGDGNNTTTANLEALFRSSEAQVETPIAGPAFVGPSTPVLLGIGGGDGSFQRRSGPTRKAYF